MNFRKGLKILAEKNIAPVMASNRFLHYGWKKVRSHQFKFESFQHFIAKACVGKLIMSLGDGMVTEYVYPNCDKIDVLQIKKDSLIGYEIIYGGGAKEDFHNTDVMVIDLKKAPKEVLESFKILKQYFSKFVIE